MWTTMFGTPRPSSVSAPTLVENKRKTAARSAHESQRNRESDINVNSITAKWAVPAWGSAFKYDFTGVNCQLHLHPYKWLSQSEGFPVHPLPSQISGTTTYTQCPVIFCRQLDSTLRKPHFALDLEALLATKWPTLIRFNWI